MCQKLVSYYYFFFFLLGSEPHCDLGGGSSAYWELGSKAERSWFEPQHGKNMFW